ncbi:MAG TPA: hypothetical protein VLB80_03490 [Candidatus Babeliales bacterium]|nr:hypothetical protein [Candidatus Babeliales bacterium]
MNIQKKTSFPLYTCHNMPPAQLWIGNHDHAIAATEQFLQKIVCPNNGCQICISCMQIVEKQHHSIMWLYPEKNYTIDQLDSLFEKISFQLQPEELFFIIIQKADFLTPSCANKLLKPMEEPPQGYHFILLAERIEQILPTIQSRCTIYSLPTSANLHASHPIVESFTTKKISSTEFTKITEKILINERESIELLDAILNYWFTLYHNGNKNKNDLQHITSIISKLQQALLQPPMPGSTVIFWRNIYLQLHDDIKDLDK